MRHEGLVSAQEFPFNTAYKRTTIVYRNSTTGGSEVYAAGSHEAMLGLMSESEDSKRSIASRADALASEGLRVICVASKTADLNHDPMSRAEAELDLRFVALAGLYDPPRLETPGAVAKCRRAGIAVHMLTRDHVKTAAAIAAQVGILPPPSGPGTADRAVMIAADFDAMTDAHIDEMDLPIVIARCTPLTKVRMVEAIHRRKGFCVMTGDGVNDSPALKQADVGIAMGKNGSDVTRESSDMIIMDDNFASVVEALGEGRRLFDNIQKVGLTSQLFTRVSANIITWSLFSIC